MHNDKFPLPWGVCGGSVETWVVVGVAEVEVEAETEELSSLNNHVWSTVDLTNCSSSAIFQVITVDPDN